MKLLSTTVTTVVFALSLGQAYAQTMLGENSAFIRQATPETGLVGNEITINQSAANRSAVQGIDLTKQSEELRKTLSTNTLNLLAPLEENPSFATQSGSGNAAHLTLENNSQIQLYQQQANNTATVNSGVNSVGTVAQIGDNNLTNMTLGADSHGLISQFGSDLEARLTLEPRAHGSIQQTGSNNIAGLDVAAGTTAVLIQDGSGMSTPNGMAVQVMSTVNTGNIVITQTGR